YRLLDENELRLTRKSDTVFIFGSGASLHSITEAEWREFERHDTIGFNRFARGRFVRCDYHLIREIAPVRGDPRSSKAQFQEYFDTLRENPMFRNAILLMQTGWRAHNPNHALGLRL